MSKKRFFIIKREDYTKFFNQVLALAVLLLVLASFVVLPFKQDELERNNIEFIKSQKEDIDHFSRIYSSKILDIKKDIQFLNSLITHHINELSDYSDVIIDFANNNMIYDQILFVDLDGRSNLNLIKSNDVFKGGFKTRLNLTLVNKLNKIDSEQVFFSRVTYNSIDETNLKEHKQHIGMQVVIDNELVGYIVMKIDHLSLMDDIELIKKESSGNLYHLTKDNHILYNEFLKLNELDHSFNKIYGDNKFELKADSLVAVTRENTLIIKSPLNYTLDRFLRDSIVQEDTSTYIALVFQDHKDHPYINETNPINVIRISLTILLVIFTVDLIISYTIIHAFFKRDYEYKRLKSLAEFDEQTGAYTRRAGFEILRTLVSDNKIIKNFTICFIDVDGLKQINDNFGHVYGDNMIKDVVDIIKGIIRKSDFVVRYGGDEFIIILPSEDFDSAKATWNKISNKFKQINDNVGLPYNYSVSAGIVENQKFKKEFKYSSKNSFNVENYIEDLINEADKRMYVDKSDNKNSKSFTIIK